MGKLVFVAMSGGVDSSVAAAKLLDYGYDVCGVNFLLDEINDTSRDAQRVCQVLGIELAVLDLRKEFKKEVMDYFASEYNAGRTPNPCVMCNKKIKFGAFYDYAMENGADFIASGHYAKIEKKGDEFFLMQAENKKKDQSYVLYNLNQEILSRTIFPIADNTKEEIREIAKAKGLFVADKPDSQDICFIPDGDYISFLKREYGFSDKKGNFLDDEKNVIGTHSGFFKFTIGQRKGLGMTFGKPVFVTEICAEDNSVTLSESGGEYFKSLIADNVNFISGKVPAKDVLTCKTRYSGLLTKAKISVLSDGRIKAEFLEPVRAVTCGQTAAFYDGEILVGGGVISKAERCIKNED